MSIAWSQWSVGMHQIDTGILHGYRLTDHDVFLISDGKALRGDVSADSILKVMRPDF